MDTIIQYLIRSLREEEIYKNNRIQHKESYILRLITLAYLTHKTMRLSDLLINTDLGSQPSIQSYLSKLIRKDFVMRKVSEADKRVQHLIPSENAIHLFQELSKIAYDERISRAD